MTLFAFDTDASDDWYIQDDGVMGGKSKGHFAVSDGHLVFDGTTVTKGGGFSSVLNARGLDLTGKTGVALRVRGGGRSFEVAFHDGVRDRGREVWRRAPFATTEDWQTVRIDFDELGATAHGEPVDVPPLDAGGVELFGFFIADGKDGPFRLEVDSVAAY